MITNKLLQEKWKAQAQIALEADHDLYKIAEKAHDIVLKMFKSKEIKYSTRRPTKSTLNL